MKEMFQILYRKCMQMKRQIYEHGVLVNANNNLQMLNRIQVVGSKVIYAHVYVHVKKLYLSHVQTTISNVYLAYGNDTITSNKLIKLLHFAHSLCNKNA